MISFYLRNKYINPSSYYRITQYLPFLDEKFVIHNLSNTCLYKMSINTTNLLLRFVLKIVLYVEIYFKTWYYYVYDLFFVDKILIQRTSMPLFILPSHYLLLKFLLMKKFVIWDIDDNLRERNEISKLEFNLLLKYSNKIIVSNIYIYIYIYIICRNFKNCNKICIIPTVDKLVDLNIVPELLSTRVKEIKKEVILVWVGTTLNLHEIEDLIPYIEKASEKIKCRVVLNIISGRLTKITSKIIKINSILWDRNKANQIIAASHIGLMPLKNNQFNKYKSAFKLVQYMSTGLPVIASDVGMNNQVVKNGINGYLIVDNADIVNAIYKIINNEKEYINMSNNSFDIWNKNYNFEKIKNMSIREWCYEN